MGIAYNTSVVRDGLVLHLDAANVKSYPGSGTNLYDLSNKTSTSTLNNGVTANEVFTFDGVNDNISVPSRTLTSWTIGYWFYHDTNSGADMTIGQNGFNANRFYHRDTGTSSYRLRVHNNLQQNVRDMVIGEGGWQSWHQLFYSMVEDGTVKGWIDGEVALNSTSANSSEFVIDNVGSVYTSGFIWQGSLNNIMVYNKQLSDSEVKQNFEALRGRYDI